MNYMFHDLIGQLVEIYIDDVIMMSQSINDLSLIRSKRGIGKEKKVWIKDEPAQVWAWLVGGRGSILGGFLVHERGIEVSHRSIESIKKMEPLAKKNRAPVIDRQDQLH
jgi:hypothetical protein